MPPADANASVPIPESLTLEVCVDSVESAEASVSHICSASFLLVGHLTGPLITSAIKGGANRLEVCANLKLGGGTTPSVGLIRVMKAIEAIRTGAVKLVVSVYRQRRGVSSHRTHSTSKLGPYPSTNGRFLLHGP